MKLLPNSIVFCPAFTSDTVERLVIFQLINQHEMSILSADVLMAGASINDSDS